MPHVNEALRFMTKDTLLSCHGTSSIVFILNCFRAPFRTIDLIQKLQNKAEDMLVSSHLHKLHAKIQYIYHVFRRERVVVRVLLMYFMTGVIGVVLQERVHFCVQGKALKYQSELYVLKPAVRYTGVLLQGNVKSF